MIFNSVEFFIFLVISYLLYWKVFQKHLKAQNLFLLIISYIFYGWWDYRFLSLIFLSTVVDYFVGQQIYAQTQQHKRKQWLWVSVVFNIGLLGFFKYFNFFVDSWVDMAALMGYHIKSTWTLRIILPVGISFYTFQTMSYAFDIYYKQLKPTKNFIAFAAFVSFFPQLVAGPIERASNLLSQITHARKFNYNQTVEGLKLILWGLFKKIVIADALAPIVDDIFANANTYPATTLILGVTLFSFQIYGDFSGYSDIAIGTAKLFGVELMTNFKFPYLSRNIAEFWQRWHISLSEWFRYYIYIPLGGSKQGRFKALRNVAIVFLISGFWHGANWTFIAWGAFHALAFIPLFVVGNNKKYKDTIVAENRVLPTFSELLKMLFVFALVTFSWIFFRADTITHAMAYIGGIFTRTDITAYAHPMGYRMIDYYVLVILFVVYEFIIRQYPRHPFPFKHKAVRFAIYTLLLFLMLLFYDDGIDKSFIYFQF